MDIEQTNKRVWAAWLARTYLVAAFFLWQFSCYYIAGDAGLSFRFDVSGWGRAVEAGYVIALLCLLWQIRKSLKLGRGTQALFDFIFAGVGAAFLLSGAGVTLQAASLTTRLVLMGVNLAMIYFSWRAWRRLDCRGFGHLFFGQVINLAQAAGFWIFLQPGQGVSAGWSQRSGQWFWDYFWVGGIISSALMAAGLIQIIRQLQTGAEAAVKPVKAGTIALAVVLLLCGLYPATVYFHSTGFITALCMNVVVLACAFRSPRHMKQPTIAAWAWAAGITLLMAMSRSFSHPQFRESEGLALNWQLWLVTGGGLAGCLWLVGLIFSVHEPDIFPLRKIATENISEEIPGTGGLPPVVPRWTRSRAFVLAVAGGLLVGVLWLQQHDPKELISLEPRYGGHPLTYWMEHWYANPWGGSVNGEAEAAVQSMGSKAVPLLVDWIGRPYTSGFDFQSRALKALELLGPAARPAVPKLIAIIGRGDAPQRALVNIGADAVPELAAKYVETLTYTNPPNYNWRSPGYQKNPARIRDGVVQTLIKIGTNAEAALPALIKGARSPQPWVQGPAIMALGRVGQNQPDAVIPVLTNLLEQPGPVAFSEIALALGSVGKNRPDMVVPILMNLLQGTNANAANQGLLAHALAEAGHARPQIIIPVLLSALEHPSLKTNAAPSRSPAIWFRSEFDYEFPRFFGAPTTDPRAGLADALATFGNNARPAVPALLAAGRDQDPGLRAHVSLAIQKIAPATPGALAPLIKNLDENDVNTRRNTLWTIESLGTNATEAIPALAEKSLHDPDREVRVRALECLGRIGIISDEIISALGEHLVSTNAESSSEAAGFLLHQMDTSPRVFPLLLKAFVHCPDGGTRRQIKDGLRSACERNDSTLIECLRADEPKIRRAALQLVDECGIDLKETRPAFIRLKNDADPEARALATNMLIEAYGRVIGQGLAEERVRSGNIDATNAQGQTPLHLVVPDISSWPSYWPENGGPYNSILLLLQVDVNVNAQDSDGSTPLHVLALKENIFKANAAKALLDAGANPNLRDKHGRTPAHLFLSGEWPWDGSAAGVDMLIKAGADLSAKDDQGKTPLHYLAGIGGPSQSPLFFMHNIGDIFAAAKPDLETRDNDGNSPLMLAAKTGTRDVFDWLLKQGANLDATNNASETPRRLAAHSKDSFFRFGPPNAETDIFQAIREGKIDAATSLLKADPQLANAADRSRQTPLRLAVVMHKTNLVELLETHGATWDAASAVMAGRMDVLPAILQKKPAAVTDTANGRGLLHFAAADGRVEMVKLLLTAGADFQAADASGLSPLGWARIQQQPAVSALLRDHGATNNFSDCVYLNDPEAVSRFLSRDPSLAKKTNQLTVSAMHIAAAAGFTDILQSLLKVHAPVNAPVEPPPKNSLSNGVQTFRFLFSRTAPPLSLAAFFNQTNAVKLLLQAGADASRTDDRGFSALHWAVIRRNGAMASLLIAHKAELNQATAQFFHGPRSRPGFGAMADEQTPAGETPLHLAVLLGETNLVHLLLKAGADVNAVNGSARTPLDEATMSGHTFRMTLPVPVMSGMAELPGLNLPPVGLTNADGDTLKIIAAMLEAAGGKHSKNHQ